jgi:hypothetical protein
MPDKGSGFLHLPAGSDKADPAVLLMAKLVTGHSFSFNSLIISTAIFAF